MFPRLYRLELEKDVIISNIINTRSPYDAAVWVWSRPPVGRTLGDLNSLLDLIAGYTFDHSREDKWVWSNATNGLFTIKTMSSLINERLLSKIIVAGQTLINQLVLRKLEIFVWRAIKKCLPVRIELDNHGIDLPVVRCLNLGNFTNLSSSEILRGNTNNSVNMSTFGVKIWQAIERISAYYIWKNRNNVIFKNKSWSRSVAFNEIQIKSFEWISQRSRGRKFDWLTWLSNPSCYLSTM
ncbi:uncharacterized protein [Rutidosis leptorrhynchoides]|uniref:uncharacterized protein n=1 Tax=Rutidosis leptorrhynchoides TaxID=125765 RepID=UPI003A995F05